MDSLFRSLRLGSVDTYTPLFVRGNDEQISMTAGAVSVEDSDSEPDHTMKAPEEGEQDLDSEPDHTMKAPEEGEQDLDSEMKAPGEGDSAINSPEQPQQASAPRQASVMQLGEDHRGVRPKDDTWVKKETFEPLVSLVSGTNFTPTLFKLYNVMGTRQGLILFKRAMRVNMRFKVRKYRALRKDVEIDANRESRQAKMTQKRLLEESGAHDAEWQAYEKNADQLIALQADVEVFRDIENAAIDRLNANNGALDTDGFDPIRDKAIEKQCNKFRESLNQLTCFNQQPEVIESVAEVVLMYINNPYTIRDRFMNFLFLGAAGTGKTTLARQISRVFSSAGMFVYDRVREAGRADFVAGFEGQTVRQTMDYLKGGLDYGVIFIDEAYSITTWSDGNLGAFGAEATNAIVDFMTKYKGLYCIMAAGYQKEMVRYFLPANPGLDRRFTYRAIVRDYTSQQLINVFKRKILEEQGIHIHGCSLESTAPADQFYLHGGWKWLEITLDLALQVEERIKPNDKKENNPAGYEFDKKNGYEYQFVKEHRPVWKYMYEIFKGQAGSMSNLAEEFVMKQSIEKDIYQLIDGDGSRGDLAIVQGNRMVGLQMNLNQLDMKNLITARFYKTVIGDLNEAAEELVRFNQLVGDKHAYFYILESTEHEHYGGVHVTAESKSIPVPFSTESGDVEDANGKKFYKDTPTYKRPAKMAGVEGGGIADVANAEDSDDNMPLARLYARLDSSSENDPRRRSARQNDAAKRARPLKKADGEGGEQE